MASDTSSATSLIRGLQAGRDESWRQLVDLYAPLVRVWCRTEGLSEPGAMDVIQEVFLVVLRRIHEFRPRPGTGGFRGWLWTIARNHIRASRRAVEDAIGGSTALARLQELPDLAGRDDDSSEPPEPPQETSALFHRGLMMVRDEFQRQTWDAFWRTVVLGETTADVASQLDMTPAAVRQARSRVLRRLRQQLGE